MTASPIQSAPRLRALFTLSLAVLLGALGTVIADTAPVARPSVIVIETFDAGLPELVDEVQLKVGGVIEAGDGSAIELALTDIDADRAATIADQIRGGAVAVTDTDDRGAVLRFDLPERDGKRIAYETYHGLLLRVFLRPRSDEADVDEATFRLLLHDVETEKVSRPAAFYHRVDLEPAQFEDAWVDLVLPFAAWRWDGNRVGNWDRVNELTIVTPPSYSVLLDEIALIPPGGVTDAHTVSDKTGIVTSDSDARLDRAALDKLLSTPGLEDQGRYLLEPDGDDWAFEEFLEAVRTGAETPTGGRFVRVYTEVATDVLTDEDAARIVDNLDRLAPFLTRLLDIGGVVDAPCPSQPPIVLIYETHADEAAFFERLGEFWNAGIAPPRGPYTVAQFAGVWWKEEYGWERPTFLHEALHAALPYWAGVPFGSGSWLHEALANFLQISVYPASLPRDAYVNWFKRDVGTRRGFKPLDRICRPGNASTSDYAQLATVIAFLLEERAGWLPQIVNAVRDGDSLATFCESQGSDIETLQAEWMAWGRERFAESEPDGTPAFDLPIEWADWAG